MLIAVWIVTLSSAPPLGEMVADIGQFALGMPPGIPAWLQSIIRLAGIKPDTGGVGAELIVKVSVAVPVPALLVALNVTVDVPAVVGVPEINPVAVLTDTPPGKPLAP